MRIASRGCGRTIVEVHQDETAALSQTLNEVLHALRIDDCEARLGASREQASVLMHRLLRLFHQFSGNEEREFDLSKDDAKMLQRAAGLCVEHINEREFSTRVGASIDEVAAYVKVLGLIVGIEGTEETGNRRDVS